MVNIIKTIQPPSLLQAKKNGVTLYDDLGKREKVDLRNKLLNDQGYICCYCQKRLPHKFIVKSKIEHFRSQENNPQLQLEYRNLFIACNGIGNSKNFTCDTNKANLDINSFNLLISNITSKIKYTKNGLIFSDDQSIKNEIESILNLNDENLRKSRASVYLGIEQIKKRCALKGNYSNSLDKRINDCEQKDATGGTFQKSSTAEVKLMMNDGAANRFAKMYYLDNATKGFDNGYDGETFGGVANTVDVFTNLLENNEGKKYQIQSLPNSDFENMVIPVGVKAAAGKEITFSVEALNIPSGINVYLEDKTTNTVTLLSEANATYKVTLAGALDGIGRFYIHTKASSVLSTETIALGNVSIYTTDASTLRVAGLSQGKASVKVFSLLGKQVFETSFNATGVKDMQLPKLASGIYVVQLATENGTLNKKITLE
jgi:uncharacterized protein (TIGR02646 family)